MGALETKRGPFISFNMKKNKTNANNVPPGFLGARCHTTVLCGIFFKCARFPQCRTPDTILNRITETKGVVSD